jgi:hypothetical protein
MKRALLVGAFAGLLAFGAAVSAMAQAASQGSGAKVNMTAQPAGPEPASPVPTGELVLGTVRLPKAVTADGKPLAAGSYQVKLTAQEAAQNPVGQTATYERWAEFSQGGTVKGREVVSIVAKSDIGKIAESTQPAAGRSKVELLKGGDFLRVWISKGDANYLIHMMVSGAAGSN